MDDFEWNVANESRLLEAMVGHKPVGVNKYFQMACIWHKFSEHLDREVPSETIWTHLESMYNLDGLDEIESLPFPNDERDFALPESEFGTLKTRKEEKTEDKAKAGPKRADAKEAAKNAARRDDRSLSKKESLRRDSKDGKDGRAAKKDGKKEPEKIKPKGRGSIGTRDEGKSLRNDDLKRLNKRPTRASIKPDETRKSQSPLTVTPMSASKRRRL